MQLASLMAPELAELRAARLAEARTAWPAIAQPDDEFLAYLADRLAPPLDASLREACVTDLWLACAVVRGETAAIAVFERRYLTDIDAALSQIDGGTLLVEDVRVALRERVYPVGGKGKLADYRGRGELRGWLRVVAVREALSILRARRREAPLDRDTLLAGSVAPARPDTTSDERRIYNEAFAAALATLTARERNLLRQQYVYGVSADELGALYGVHRATAARWVARVRELLLARTRRHLGEALRLQGDELDSVMGRVANHLDYSLRHTLSIEGPREIEG